MRILYFIGQLFFIPHYCLYFFSKNRKIIKKDLVANRKTNHINKKVFYHLTYELLTNPYFRTLFYFRTPGFCSKLLRVFYRKHPSLTIDIHTRLGAGVCLAHPYSTIINAKSIGENLYINHLVTIGEIDNKKPTIGNNVKIHANATLIGGINIGDNAIIGAGAVVVKDVPKNAIAIGNPAKNHFKK
jgi:serine O-acetyltransferase